MSMVACFVCGAFFERQVKPRPPAKPYCNDCYAKIVDERRAKFKQMKGEKANESDGVAASLPETDDE